MERNKTFFAGIAAALVIVIIILVTVIVRSGSGMQKKQCELYFLNEEGTSIVAETREIKYRDESSLPQAVTEQLMKGPENNKYSRIMNKNTRLIGIEADENDNVVINFTSEYLTGDPTHDIQTTYAVVKSLSTIKSVNSVKVIVEGKDIQTADGGTVGYLTAEDINLSTDTYTTEMREITLYFADKSTGKLIMEQRIVKVEDQQPIEQYIISELIRGPLGNDVGSVLDKDTTLISVDTEEEICFVNFKTDFISENTGKENTEKLAIYSIVNSLTELDTIKSVQFLIDGKKSDNFGTMNIYRPFERNELMID